MRGFLRLLARLSLSTLLTSFVSSSPWAQSGGLGGRGQGQRQNTPEVPTSPPHLTPPAEIWPRLDPGVVLCATSDDLLRYQRQLVVGTNAMADAPQPDCRRVVILTPIKIIGHDGPSRTHVIAIDTSKQMGWTNAYLPDKSPASALR
jgi:hypothetical protein